LVSNSSDRQEVMRLPGEVVQVLDAPRGQGVQGQRVVDGDGDPARRGGRVRAENVAHLRLEGKMAAVVLGHLHPVHPLWREIMDLSGTTHLHIILFHIDTHTYVY